MRQQQERLAKREEAAAEKEKKAAERKRAQEERKKYAARSLLSAAIADDRSAACSKQPEMPSGSAASSFMSLSFTMVNMLFHILLHRCDLKPGYITPASSFVS